MGKLKAASDPQHVIFVDVDGCPASISGIKNGYLDADASQQIMVMGSTAAKVALEAAGGKAPADKSIRLKPAAITSGNAADMSNWGNAIQGSK